MCHPSHHDPWLFRGSILDKRLCNKTASPVHRWLDIPSELSTCGPQHRPRVICTGERTHTICNRPPAQKQGGNSHSYPGRFFCEKCGNQTNMRDVSLGALVEWHVGGGGAASSFRHSAGPTKALAVNGRHYVPICQLLHLAAEEGPSRLPLRAQNRPRFESADTKRSEEKKKSGTSACFHT